MLFLKYLLLITGSGLLAGAAGILTYDLAMMWRKRRQGEDGKWIVPFPRWRTAGKLAALGAVPILAGVSIAVEPARRIAMLAG